ncbi:MAG: glycosyltransferase family 2 protein [Deferrisomatales bacterium]|nr:glycosyltransferase family 2 protein [Deferrisomatales bacterium]
MTSTSITFLVPAYNEASNLAAAIEGVREAVDGVVEDWHVLIVDDGSTDGTGAIAEQLAREDDRVRVVHNGRNRGLGYNYATGVQLVETDYVMMVPGDNEVLPAAVRGLLQRLGCADVVIAHTVNPEVRTRGRALLSKVFTALVNALFGLHIRYYNGTTIHRTALIRQVPITTGGFGFQAETLVRLLRSGCSYVQAPMMIRARPGGRSKALRPRNVVSVLSTLARLFLSVQVLERRRYGCVPREIPDPLGVAVTP